MYEHVIVSNFSAAMRTLDSIGIDQKKKLIRIACLMGHKVGDKMILAYVNRNGLAKFVWCLRTSDLSVSWTVLNPH